VDILDDTGVSKLSAKSLF